MISAKVCASRIGVARIGVGLGVGLGFGLGLSSFVMFSLPAAASPQANKLNASYSIKFNGIKLGKFNFSSTRNGDQYSLYGRAKMKLLFGAFKWDSTTTAGGVVGKKGPRPTVYNFRYESKKKSGFTKMAFRSGAVDSLELKPKSSSKGRVPVKKEHMSGVFDPLSAIMAMTLASGSVRRNPCRRTIPVFDGKQRFNVVLSPKRLADVRDRLGRLKSVFVCKARYVPVAGHKMNRGTKFMMAQDGIEIWLTPMAEAGLYMPVTIVLPTPIGAATIQSEKVDIETDRRQKIALNF